MRSLMFSIKTYYYHLQQDTKVMYISYSYQFSDLIKIKQDQENFHDG